MSGKHTTAFLSWSHEGPWKVFDASGEFVCEIQIDTDNFRAPDESPEGIANAHLSAAASDLLDALERLLELVRAHTERGEVIPAHTVEHVRSCAAIAKARGQA